MNRKDTEKTVRVSARSYTSWLLFMGIILIGAVCSEKYRIVFIGAMLILTVIFFQVKDKEIFCVKDGKVTFRDDRNELTVDEKDLISFEYLNNETSTLQIRYRENGIEKTFLMSTFNLVAVHKALDSLYPEKNLVRNEYEEKLAENRKANREYFERIKDKILSAFKK